MNAETIFPILEMEPTDDIRVIKKAYAKLVMRYHPEDDPEKWKEIHDAYKAALRIAEHNSLRNSAPEIPSDIGRTQSGEDIARQPSVSGEDMVRQPIISAEDEEIDELFDALHKLSARQQAEEEGIQEKRLGRLVDEAQVLLGTGNFSRPEWEKLLNPDNMLLLTARKDYMYQFGSCFVSHRIDAETWKFLKDRLQEISGYYQSKNESGQDHEGIYGAISYAERKIDSAHYANVGKKAKENAVRDKKRRTLFPKIFFGICVAITAIALIIDWLDRMSTRTQSGQQLPVHGAETYDDMPAEPEGHQLRIRKKGENGEIEWETYTIE